MSSAKPTEVSKLVHQIEDILAWFESEEVDLEQALKKYEQGLGYIDQLEKYLAGAKLKVTKINRKFD